MKLLYLVFFLIFSAYSQAPSKPYSFWLNKTNEFYRIHNDSTLFYAKKMQLYADSPCDYLNGLMFEANAIYFKRDCSKSKEVSLKILKKLNTEDSTLYKSCFLNIKSHVLGRLSYIEKCLGDYSKALEYIELNENLCEKNNFYSEKYKLALQYQTALIYIELEKYESAIKLLSPLKNISTVNENKLTLPSINVALGDSYLKSYEKFLKPNFLDSAKTYYGKHYKSAIQIEQQTNHTQKLFDIKMGVIALHQQKYEHALSLLRKAKKIKLTEEKHFTNQETYLYLAKAFYNLNRQDSCLYYGNLFLEKNILHPRNNNLLLKGYTILANSYNKTQQLEKAYKYSTLALSEIKKLDTLKINGIEQLSFIALKKINNTNQVLLNQKKNRWFVYKIFFILLSIFLLVVLIRSYILRTKTDKKYQALISLEAEKKIPTPQSTENNSAPKIAIREDIINKIISGLDELELQKAFLNPEFSLKYVASKLDSNTSYISKIINSHTGVSFTEHTNNLRIQHITKSLTENPELRKHSLDAIAKDFGYSSASSFSKIFKKTVGMNPSCFIKKLIEEDDKNC
ncbi:helix-turn-helix domain-containing protein [Aquimarina sp. Aq78]|uniref:helix-turn-helix domain-containing protein n=1 Tax=Aquimarina sp. Aq78 TaxID=1191889 RepID=UPI000D0E4FE8|nr:helix-turn-helix domain-containing protein [Aquimarina sp. Aq78]